MNNRNQKNELTTETNIQSKTYNRNKFYLGIVIILITLIAYIPTFQNGFTNWDDHEYVVDNQLIHQLSTENIKTYFSTYFMNNYHPLTMLSLAIDYQFAGLERPWFYHLINLLLHIINTIFVFYFVYVLWKEYQRNSNADPGKGIYVAGVTAILFGIHTLHVESVAWVSERKDVLYTMFFLASLISYVRYTENYKAKYYLLSMVLFILSLLSKGMAVSLALTVLAIDFFLSRKLLSKKVIIEKIPFLLLSVIFGIIAIKAQQTTGTTTNVVDFSFSERILFACYGFSQYVFKLIYPFRLSAFYPYPESISFIYWLYPLIVLAIILVFKTQIKRSRPLSFGIAFFIINIILVLQLLPVGNAVMADRYAYVPSIGFFFLIGFGFNQVHNLLKRKWIILIVIFGYVGLLGVLTFERTKIWKDSFTLWDDVLAKYPNTPTALNNRGAAKEKLGDYKGAVVDYNKALKINNKLSRKTSPKKQTIKSSDPIKDKQDQSQKNARNSETYSNMGIAKAKSGDYLKAIEDFDKALELNPGNATAFSNRGSAKIYLERYQSAIQDFNRAIKLDPRNTEAFFNRGIAKYYLEKFNDAIKDFDVTIELMPNHGEAYLSRGIANIFTENVNAGCNDLKKARSLNVESAKEYIKQYCN